MERAAARRTAWTAGFASSVLIVGDVALLFVDRHARLPAHAVGWTVQDVSLAVTSIAFAAIGVIVASRRPDHPIGWLALAGILALSIAQFALAYALRALFVAPGSLPAGRFAAWLGNWGGALPIAALAFLFLIFPTGRLPSRSWRPAAWFMVVAFAALTLDLMIQGARNWSDPFARAATAVSLVVEAALVGALVLSVGSTVVRFVRAQGDERLQMKWFAAAAVPVLLATVGWSLSYSTEAGTAWSVAWHVSLLFLAASIGVAVTKYRLYDIDLVINKTVVYFSLAAVITAIYVGLAVGVGSLVGSAGKPNLPLSILATAIVAVAFQPLRQRVQRLANRLIYGRQATPYEVLSDFSSRMAGAYAADELLPRMARILTEGTGSSSGQVWLKVGGDLRVAASWPETATARPSVPSPDGSLPDLPGATLALPVHHHGELLGALAVTKASGERVTPTEHRLIADLASQAGLVLRNVRLTEELLQRLDELQESRRRLVAAQDSERRRLERNIHDGAQQQLVALAVKVRVARAMTARDPAKAEELHDQIEHELAEALEDLRNLARGIYPPLLADRGLVAALDAQARRSPIPVTVEADGIGRYSQDREAAVYFCALEALQNVAKYAGASSAAVRLREENGSLTFEVTDDGVGFDLGTTTHGTGLQGMADRLAAMGGQLSVSSSPGAGTVVTGSIPSDS